MAAVLVCPGSSGERLAREQMDRRWIEAERFKRGFLPQPQRIAGLGDEAIMLRGLVENGTFATLLVRRAALVLEVHYEMPPAVPVGRAADPSRYQPTVTAVEELARHVLARL